MEGLFDDLSVSRGWPCRITSEASELHNQSVVLIALDKSLVLSPKGSMYFLIC